MMRQHGAGRAACRLAVAAAILLGSAGTAFAQLDPLLFMKTSKPNVLLVVDTANRMQRDANNDYYDQNTYQKTGQSWEWPLGVFDWNTSQYYRRRYHNLQHLNTGSSGDKFQAETISIVGDLQSRFSTFDARTRWGIARQALIRAVQLNSNVARFGLIKMRQLNPALGAAGNEGPVKDDDINQQSPTDYSYGKWHITRPTVGLTNGSQTSIVAPLCKPDAATCGTGSSAAAPNDYVRALLAKGPEQGGLIPAGQDSIDNVDAPVKFMLDDAKDAATKLITADTMYRNTIVVLVVGGPEGTTSGADPVAAASSFLAVSGRRVPIYVIAVLPTVSWDPKLVNIATNSGGQYYEITRDMVYNVAPGAPVPEFVRAVNVAVQHTFASFADFNSGTATEYQVTSPIIGSVNLANSVDIAGNALESSVVTEKNGNVIPQRSNVLVTTGVATPGAIGTPGFPGRLRAFRVYRPVIDSSKTSGYKFVGDGTALWVARTPRWGEGARNIFTVLPGGSMVPFNVDNAAVLAQYLNDKDSSGVVSTTRAADLIDYIRHQPLGAFIDSTPAFLDAPSLDPPPDSDYPGFVANCKLRRTLIFVGANDGMLHAIDGRTGVEVWAFIPFNLLPKLRALREGQPVDGLRPADFKPVPGTSGPNTYPDGVTRIADGFRYFMDGSPKLADVKIGGSWRTYMVIGEGPGGTFYQTFDVTMPNLGITAPPDSSDVTAMLSYFSNPSAIAFQWSFPSYSHFNYAATPSADFTIPLYGAGSTATPYGDLDKNGATAVEKSVGQTWSDPAVGQVKNASGSWVTLVGSGFMPYSQQLQPNRGSLVGGTTFYVLDMATGAVLDSRNVGNDGTAEMIDNCAVSADITKSGAAGAPDCTKQKNAVQSDPVATGPANSRFVDTAYIGDLDGRLWRFGLGLNGSNAANISAGPVKLFDAGNSQPLYSSMAVVNVGGTQQYIFFGSGSDLLPSVLAASQSYKMFGVLDQNGSGLQKFVISLTAVNPADNSGERISAYPAVAGDIVFFTTTTYKALTSGQAPDANIYAFTFIGGPAYDNTGDNAVTSKDTPKVKTMANAGRATAPFVADQHLVMAVGGKVVMFGDPEDFNNGVGQMGVKILSWREIR